MPLRPAKLADLEIRDEATFRHLPLYGRLKQRLVDDGYRFLVAGEEGQNEDWARVLFLNLTFWQGAAGDDVLAEAAIDADVVAHVAWHHLIRARLAELGCADSADAHFFGEAVASAFDLYLVGASLGRSRSAGFLDTAVPAMTEVAYNAGLEEDEAAELVTGAADDPGRAFEDLRALLFDVTTALLPCAGVAEATDTLERFRDRRFAPLLHHFELSNWLLYARAHGLPAAPVEAIRAWDAELRAAPSSVDALVARCLP